jgi:ElaB/YqjD/DUF883 family membrane-anchored ribosome-binding protein
MATTNRNLEEEFDKLKAGLDMLHKDIGAFVRSFNDSATDEVAMRGRLARAAVGRAADRTGEMWEDATNEARRHGREGMAAVGQQIEERPFISVMVAFGIGVVVAFGVGMVMGKQIK